MVFKKNKDFKAKNSFFSMILARPLLLLIIFSFWPLIKYVDIIFRIFNYSNLLFFFLSLHLSLILFIYFRIYKYFKFSKFSNYQEAFNYFSDLKRVKLAERKAKRFKIKKDKILKKESKLQKHQAELNRLKYELEERKKRVL